MADHTIQGGYHQGIAQRNLDYAVQDLLLNAAGQADQVALRPGANAHNVMYVPANVVNGDTITIGDDEFEVDIINTDTTINLSGAMDGTSDPVLLTASATLAKVAGNLLKLDNEILKIITKVDTTHFVCARARCGTAIATHVDTSDIIGSDADPTVTIPVGLVTTLTPAAFSQAFAAEFNNAKSGTTRLTVLASTEFANFTAYALGTKNQVLVVANEPGVDTTATTEDFANSTDNVWANATMVGGLDAAVAKCESVSRVPTAAEELAGYLHFIFPFTVRTVSVEMVITASGLRVPFTGEVLVGFAETTTEVLPGTVVTLVNTGAASTAYANVWSVSTTVSITAFE